MTLQQPPLFMQTGKYRALDDRYLIGAMLYPAGGDDQNPRAGVRPFGTLASSDSAEASFRVVATANIAEVVIDEGAAFVRGSSAQTLNGVYLVVNAGGATVSLGNTGASRTVRLYLVVLDAENSEGTTGSSAAETMFVVQPAADPAPQMSLVLAECDVSATGSVTAVRDKRKFTSSHGGSVVVASTADFSEMSRVPMGSTAYNTADGLLYMRSKRGWESVGAVATGATANRPQDMNAYVGQLFFDTTRGVLEMFLAGALGWQQVAGVTGEVRLQSSGAYDATRRVRHVSAFVGEFTVKMTVGGTWAGLDGNLMESVTNKPSAASVEARFTVSSARTVVMATLSTEVWVNKDEDANTESVNFCDVGVQLSKYAGATFSEYVDQNNKYKFTNRGDNAYVFYGMRFTGRKDSFKSRTVFFDLDPGEYMVRPLFRNHGADTGKNRLNVRNLVVEVAL